MAHAAPGKSQREGISLMQLVEMFPDEESARLWFEGIAWPKGRYCPKCGSTNTHEAKHVKCPYRCRDCRKYFSVKTGTVMASSPIPLRKWVFAIYLEVVNLKGISAMKLHRDLDVSYPTAWFMLHRIREAFSDDAAEPMHGPVEVDETYVGGKFKAMHAVDRKRRRKQPNLGKSVVI
ncbi:MAG: IS1595 family transposase, partial [Rhodospirillales bacterium]|nr:IS1595 family transposase [Rhodospirillales bacterium]